MDSIVHRFLPNVGLQILEGLFLLAKQQITLGPIEINFQNLFFLVQSILELPIIFALLLYFSINSFRLAIIATRLLSNRLLLLFFLQIIANTQHIVQISIAFLIPPLHGINHRTQVKVLYHMVVG